jgi:hypothetical protein|tara:strand:+ start:1224 stop:1538 length:315 start_codon:yes stop_codon:yes gene_type:complete
MLPKSFQKQNTHNKNKLASTIKLYTITYDYELSEYYSKYVKESYNRWGNIVDNLGVMKLTGYDVDEVEFNFHQLMSINYIDTHKIISCVITNISEELFINKPIR